MEPIIGSILRSAGGSAALPKVSLGFFQPGQLLRRKYPLRQYGVGQPVLIVLPGLTLICRDRRSGVNPHVFQARDRAGIVAASRHPLQPTVNSQDQMVHEKITSFSF